MIFAWWTIPSVRQCPFKGQFFICTVTELGIWMFFLTFFSDVFVVFVYFGFNIWHAAVAHFDGVATEQFTKFMTWREGLSYEIQKIISNFCFDINTK